MKIYQMLFKIVSWCVKEVIGQLTEVINQAKEYFKKMSTVASQESTMTMETDSDSTDTDNYQWTANIIHHPIKSSTDISTVLSSMFAEKKERSKHQFNVIVHNLEEVSENQTRSTRTYRKLQKSFNIWGLK